MFIAVIDNGTTWLLDIRDNLDIDLETLENEWTRRYVAWVVNREGIVSLIKGFNIKRFVIKHPETGLEDITPEQACMLFEKMDEYRKNKSNSIHKK